MQIIVEESGRKPKGDSLTYTRLVSHLYYILLRTRNSEPVGVDLNDYMEQKYPDAMKTARKVCGFISEQIQLELDELELGYLAVHIERYLAEL